MGDTIIPATAFVQRERQLLNYFRGALLTRGHQRAFDWLFDNVEMLTPAITMAEHLPRTEALQLVMMVSLSLENTRLNQKIEELQRKLDRLIGNEEDHRLVSSNVSEQGTRGADSLASG